MHSFGFGINQWKICNWHECQGCKSPLQEGDRMAIEALLHSLDSVQLRQLAVRYDDFLLSGISHLDDYKLNRWLVSQFTCGRLRICGLPIQEKTSTGGASSAPAQPEPPPPQSQPRKRSTANASTPTPSSTADAQTFPSNFDAVAAVKVLKEAAKDGVPFCEECMKAALAKGSS